MFCNSSNHRDTFDFCCDNRSCDFSCMTAQHFYARNFKLRKVCSHLSQFGGYFASFLYIALVLVRFALGHCSVLFHLPSLAPDSLFTTLFSTVSRTSPALAHGFLLVLLGLLILAFCWFFFASVQNVRSTSAIVCFLFFENPAKKRWHTSATNQGCISL